MTNSDYDSGNDSSDEDYVPGAGGTTSGDIPSEVDSDGDPEDPISDVEDNGGKNGRRKKATKKKASSRSKKEMEVEPVPEQVPEVKEEKKKHDDDLWANFKRDTGFKKKSNSKLSTNGQKSSSSASTTIPSNGKPKSKYPDTVKITEIFEYAGEQVKVEKEVSADSAAAKHKLLNIHSPGSASAVPKRKQDGIESILDNINKKQKLNVLEKTRLDWNQFKAKEEICDELEAYKKGKDGYLEKQDFLERADMRQFELEKAVRVMERSKRINN